jgi:hypothetical protein
MHTHKDGAAAAAAAGDRPAQCFAPVCTHVRAQSEKEVHLHLSGLLLLRTLLCTAGSSWMGWCLMPTSAQQSGSEQQAAAAATEAATEAAAAAAGKEQTLLLMCVQFPGAGVSASSLCGACSGLHMT